MTRFRRYSRPLVFGLLAASCFFLTSIAAAQSEVDDQRWMLWENGVGIRWLMYHLEKPEVELLKAKWEAIGQNPELGDYMVGGDYIVPNYMAGYFLRWSKEKGYVFVRFFDVEHPCHFTFGDVEATASTVRFIQKGEAGQSVCPSGDDGAPAVEWVFAAGGRFLIPKSRLRDFADYFGGFGKYNGNNRSFDDVIPFAIRPRSATKEPPAFILPKEFSKFVRQPLVGSIVSVGKTRTRKSKIFNLGADRETVTPVTIDIGRSQGLRPRQEFVLLTDDDDYRSETLIVEKVGRNRSSGIVVRKADEKGKEGFYEWDEALKNFKTTEFTKLRPGIRVTTSPAAKL